MKKREGATEVALRESDDVSIAGAASVTARSCEGDGAGFGLLQVSERKLMNQLARDEKKFASLPGITCAANPAQTRRNKARAKAAKRGVILGIRNGLGVSRIGRKRRKKCQLKFP